MPACVMNPSNLSYSIIETLTSIGTQSAPAGFATLIKNTDGSGSFKLSLYLSDPLLTGITYTFALSFTYPSVATVTQPTSSSFNVLVKCTKSVDCSASS